MHPFKPWTVATIAVATVLYVVALSHAVYETTSPAWLSWHVVLRKIYSVAAFAIVGTLLRRALGENGYAGPLAPACVLAVATYSAAIEVGQYVHGSLEGLGWNVFDTLCGACGGALATIDRMRRTA